MKKIIADIREKNSLVAADLFELGIDVDFKHLKVADYLIGDTAIERKTISDFISSMINKRLARQLEEIKQYPKPLLIIEGIEEQELYNDLSEGINGNAIRGFLLSIVLELNVPIIHTNNCQDTAKFLMLLAKKQSKSHISIRATKKAKSKKQLKQFILEGYPGIGPATAKKLLKKYKNIKNIINQPIENLKKNIGKKAEIFKINQEKY
jgi:Fanconi anemia group M protein